MHPRRLDYALKTFWWAVALLSSRPQIADKQCKMRLFETAQASSASHLPKTEKGNGGGVLLEEGCFSGS